ncbi:hypothetical protein TREMEDRAFT_66278 [Tremella mesenterica DSM 1558]|uniref:uncharacterized protein n=1 Tax=Tremella mesenterica (strain ATCC 24925 / CBS 8224 / DSM 1558 / NBRC 9311 / NRRL Y-6157 / RJB 2259-6 / UBC 559-6) TaxID=578456 RepID=UPI00032C75F9|nr:uncharacterized protein TREMEDRAFT_66278 [Tremella mesenterica DSM 1558]EIW65684.1 hypothetical protein TREMEDRAFT_66278 [Tremella mesenterica DSM 1558]
MHPALCLGEVSIVAYWFWSGREIHLSEGCSGLSPSPGGEVTSRNSSQSFDVVREGNRSFGVVIWSFQVIPEGSSPLGIRLRRLILLALKNVKKSGHIPCRDSKLTHLLENALGGNSNICVICTLSAEEEHASETLETLKFAGTCSQVETQAKKNILLSSDRALIKAKDKEIEVLKRRLQVLADDRPTTPHPGQIADLADSVAAMEATSIDPTRSSPDRVLPAEIGWVDGGIAELAWAESIASTGSPAGTGTGTNKRRQRDRVLPSHEDRFRLVSRWTEEWDGRGRLSEFHTRCDERLKIMNIKGKLSSASFWRLYNDLLSPLLSPSSRLRLRLTRSRIHPTAGIRVGVVPKTNPLEEGQTRVTVDGSELSNARDGSATEDETSLEFMSQLGPLLRIVCADEEGGNNTTDVHLGGGPSPGVAPSVGTRFWGSSFPRSRFWSARNRVKERAGEEVTSTWRGVLAYCPATGCRAVLGVMDGDGVGVGVGPSHDELSVLCQLLCEAASVCTVFPLPNLPKPTMTYAFTQTVDFLSRLVRLSRGESLDQVVLPTEQLEPEPDRRDRVVDILLAVS